MKHMKPVPLLFAVLLMSVFLTGCFSLKPQPDPSRFFVLGEAVTTATKGGLDCPRIVLVGPVRLAGHLESTRIAQRHGAHEIVYFDWDYWAESLSTAVPAQLITRLENRLPDVCVASYQTLAPKTNTIQLAVFVDQFEMTENQEVVAAMRWTITDPDDPKTVKQGETRMRRTNTGTHGDVASGVAALSNLLDELADQLAGELK